MGFGLSEVRQKNGFGKHNMPSMQGSCWAKVAKAKEMKQMGEPTAWYVMALVAIF